MPKTPDAKTNLQMALACGIKVLNFGEMPREEWPVSEACVPNCFHDGYVDALLGIGMKGKPDEITAAMICAPHHDFGNHVVIAVDIPSGVNADTGAVEGGWDEADTESIVASLNEKVEEGMINISMNTSPNFPNGTSEGNLMIVNESINRYPQIVEIIRNDTGEVIYKSGAIPVGSKIEAAKLSVDLDAGMYECTAMFYNVDPNTGNYLGCAGAIIHLTVVE